MVTVAKTYDMMAFKGLSTDEKPTVTFGNEPIINGSTFYEMDTKSVYMYDAENEQWLKQ